MERYNFEWISIIGDEHDYCSSAKSSICYTNSDEKLNFVDISADEADVTELMPIPIFTCDSNIAQNSSLSRLNNFLESRTAAMRTHIRNKRLESSCKSPTKYKKNELDKSQMTKSFYSMESHSQSFTFDELFEL